MASLVARLKSFGKRVIGQPEEPVPVVTVKDWVRNLSKDPKHDVCIMLIFLRSIYSRHLGPELRRGPLSHRRLDHALQWVESWLQLCLYTRLIAFLDFGWLYGDVVAGLTVGIVVVPQSMSYAQVCAPAQGRLAWSTDSFRARSLRSPPNTVYTRLSLAF